MVKRKLSHSSSTCPMTSTRSVVVVVVVTIVVVGTLSYVSAFTSIPTNQRSISPIRTTMTTTMKTSSSSLLSLQAMSDPFGSTAMATSRYDQTTVSAAAATERTIMMMEQTSMTRIEPSITATFGNLRLSSTDNRLSTTQLATSSTLDDVMGWCTNTAIPVLSAALLITGNTVGAGCLVLPQLVSSLGSNGLCYITVMYVVAWILNVISALVLAEVAITQKETMTAAATTTNDAWTINKVLDMDVDVVPTSFKDFASVNLQSSTAGNVVSAISFGVNACIVAFDLNRAGSIGSNVLASITNNLLTIDENIISIICALTVTILMTTLSSTALSAVCSVCVAVLFVSFGGLLLPGITSMLTVSSSSSDVVAATTSILPPLSEGNAMLSSITPEVWDSISSIFPIVLMSMIFQNIVPVVVKHMKYQRNMSIAAITIGSCIPLCMYVAWCYTCCMNGIGSIDVSGPLIIIFSIATLAGSTICTSMSLVEEMDTVVTSTTTHNQNDQSTNVDLDSTSLSPYTTIPSVAIPLVAALLFGTNNPDNNGLTGALAIAGSFGSPLLYGILPALMAWRQRQQQQGDNKQRRQQQQYIIPSSALPVLGLLSTISVGQEMLSQFTEFVSIATA